MTGPEEPYSQHRLWMRTHTIVGGNRHVNDFVHCFERVFEYAQANLKRDTVQRRHGDRLVVRHDVSVGGVFVECGEVVIGVLRRISFGQELRGLLKGEVLGFGCY